MALEQREPSDNSLEDSPENHALQQQAYPNIHSIPSVYTQEKAQAKAVRIAEQLGWTIYYQEQGHIEASVKSFWFGFTDDIVIRITQTPSGSIIDLRSASRVGKGDLGENAKRVKLFIEEYLH